MKSVRTKIIALVLGCIIITSCAVGGASILNSKRVVVDESERIMNLLCSDNSKQIDMLLSNIEQSVTTLSLYSLRQLDDVDRFKTDPAYVDEYSNKLLEVAMNAAKNTKGALTVYIRYNPEFTDPKSGFFSSKEGQHDLFKELPTTDLSLYDSSDVEHVGWFYEPAKNKKGTWMDPYFNKNIGVDMISYVVPLYVNQELIGVVGMDIDFNVIKDIAVNTGVYDTGYAFLTNNSSNIVYHKELARNTDLKQYNRGEFRKMAETLQEDTGSENKLIAYTYKGEDKKAAFRSLSNGMRLVLTAPSKEIEKRANDLIIQILVAVLLTVLAGAVVTLFFTKRLVKPLLELNDAAKKIADGDLSISIIHQSNDEVGTLAESFRQTVAHLHKYISYINELAYRDSLTGVKNKTAYLEVVARMNEQIRLKRPMFAVVVFDINGLKKANDTWGHDFGDILIINSCKLICKVFKQSPVYRIGGDEFVVLLENHDYEHYQELLKQFETEVEQFNINTVNGVKVSVARGISIYSENTDLTYNDVFKRADNAMYCNKAEMKNREAKEQ